MRVTARAEGRVLTYRRAAAGAEVPHLIASKRHTRKTPAPRTTHSRPTIVAIIGHFPPLSEQQVACARLRAQVNH